MSFLSVNELLTWNSMSKLCCFGFVDVAFHLLVQSEKNCHGTPCQNRILKPFFLIFDMSSHVNGIDVDIC